MNTENLITELHQLMYREWETILKTNPFTLSLMSGKADKRLFALYLTQVYHLTRHNPVNQALVAQNILNNNPYKILSQKTRYMKFCFHHAEEEVGHEYMALHDLKNLGVEVQENEMPDALAATKVFIDKVYDIALNAHPAARLGYSYWAEGCYEIFKPFSQGITAGMGITAKSTTFLDQHSAIDEKHFEEVKDIIHVAVQDDTAAEGVRQALIETIKLTGDILANVHEEYLKLVEEQSSYNFLNQI
jgi:pyrroloquinoline quinone (PQQ) biosynthesis protein C